jgi:uncharacterized protein YidB (DUF937 family)
MMTGLSGFLGSIIGSALFDRDTGDPMNDLERVLRSLIDNGIGTRSQLLNTVLSAVRDSGGMEELAERLKSMGLQAKMESWVGTGSNQNIDPEELQGILNSAFVSKAASRLGVDAGSAGKAIASLLPQIIDQMTPDGKFSGGEDDLIEQALSLLGKDPE